MIKKEKGITLIALVITIIVMLILVLVTINIAMDGGLFKKARQAALDTERQTIYESIIGATVLNKDGSINVEETKAKAKAALEANGNTVEVTDTENGVEFKVTGKTGTTFSYKISETGVTIIGDEPTLPWYIMTDSDKAEVRAASQRLGGTAGGTQIVASENNGTENYTIAKNRNDTVTYSKQIYPGADAEYVQLSVGSLLYIGADESELPEGADANLPPLNTWIYDNFTSYDGICPVELYAMYYADETQDEYYFSRSYLKRIIDSFPNSQWYNLTLEEYGAIYNNADGGWAPAFIGIIACDDSFATVVANNEDYNYETSDWIAFVVDSDGYTTDRIVVNLNGGNNKYVYLVDQKKWYSTTDGYYDLMFRDRDYVDVGAESTPLFTADTFNIKLAPTALNRVLSNI